MPNALEGLSWGFEGTESACHVGSLCLNPRLGRCPGEGNSKPLQWKIPWTEEPAKLPSIELQNHTRLSNFTSQCLREPLGGFKSK